MSGLSQILFIDAYDSFSSNIVALLRRVCLAEVTIVRIDDGLTKQPGLLGGFLSSFDAIVLGPGPGNPKNKADTGLFSLVWESSSVDDIPVLGICLGFQSLCVSFGLTISRLDLPCHGHAKVIRHDNAGIFRDVGEVVATCYNSLGIRLTSLDITPDISRPPSSASDRSDFFEAQLHLTEVEGSEQGGDEALIPNKGLRLLASDDDGYIMAVKHHLLPFWGFQFHPESCKSNSACEKLLQSWWKEVQTHNTRSRSSTTAVQRAIHPKNNIPLELAPSSEHTTVLRSLKALTASMDVKVGYRRLPFACERQQLADLCFSLSQDGSVAMLESTRRGRSSIFAITDQSTWRLEYERGCLAVKQSQKSLYKQETSISNAMQTIEAFLSEKVSTDGAPESPFWGGLMGYVSYEAGLDLLDVSTTDRNSPRAVPDLSLLWVERSIVVDHQTNTILIQSLRRDDDCWLEAITTTIGSFAGQQHPVPQSSQPVPPPTCTTLPAHDKYISKIRSCQSSLHAGDSYELCLTTSATIDSPLSPYKIYTHLQHSNPAPYSAYLHLSSTHILSSSPEQFLSWSRSNPWLDMMPMKGTLPKSATINSIEKARSILLNPKEEAENLMIADLIRHDLHSSLGPGGHVTVEKLFEVVETESLYQLISHVRGHIPPPPPIPTPTPSSLSQHRSNEKEARARNILHHAHRTLRNALPAGSMTGAPKKRSCEILRSLEQRNRGVYSGVIGYFDIGGGGGVECGY